MCIYIHLPPLLIHSPTHSPICPPTQLLTQHSSTRPLNHHLSISSSISIHPPFLSLLNKSFVHSSTLLPTIHPRSSIIHPSTHPSNDLSVYPPSVYPSSVIYLFIHLPIHLPTILPSIFAPSIYLVILLFAYLTNIYGCGHEDERGLLFDLAQCPSCACDSVCLSMPMFHEYPCAFV